MKKVSKEVVESARSPMPSALSMKVHSIAFTGQESRPLLILKDDLDSVSVPIWLSPAEAGYMVSQTQAAKVQSVPDGLGFRLMQELDLQVESCILTHVEGHYQYGHLVLQGMLEKLSAKAGEMLPVANYLSKPIWVLPDFIRASREMNGEMQELEKDLELKTRGHRISKPYFH